MSLSDLASVGSFASGVAVLISLIYLAQQVRQGEKNQKALVHQGRAALTADVPMRVADPDVAAPFAKGQRGEDISLVEFYQYRLVVRAQLAVVQQTFYQHRERVIDDAAFRTLNLRLRREFAAPGRRAMWRLEREWYEEGFRTFVDQAVRESGPWASDELAEWRSALAAEKVALEGQAATSGEQRRN
jgi:hypothetical protein